MPRQNRVTPYGEVIAVADRGMFWGNRGCLHDRNANVVRYARGRAWAICVLQFKGRRRSLMAPGRLTELFFLDEATALAAGHRPCGECRATDYRAFKAAWSRAHPGEEVNAAAIDAHLHTDRMVGLGEKRTYRAHIHSLPDGTFVDMDTRAWLVWGDQLLAWAPGGYGPRQTRSSNLEVTVLTPRATVATLAGGYRPVVHPSADAGGQLCAGGGVAGGLRSAPPRGPHEGDGQGGEALGTGPQ